MPYVGAGSHQTLGHLAGISEPKGGPPPGADTAPMHYALPRVMGLHREGLGKANAVCIIRILRGNAQASINAGKGRVPSF